MSAPLFDPDKMFVYGTLMQGFALYHLLESRARCIGRGTVPGQLVSLGDFPGLLAPIRNGETRDEHRQIDRESGRGAVYQAPKNIGSGLEDSRQRVHGELYQADRPEALWPLLDEAEGFNPASIEQSVFVREVTNVSMADGSVTRAWVYRYNGPLSGAAPIPSGDYRLHATLANH